MQVDHVKIVEPAEMNMVDTHVCARLDSLVDIVEQTSMNATVTHVKMVDSVCMKAIQMPINAGALQVC